VSVKGHNGTVHFDGEFVTIERSGFLARASVGKGVKRIPITSIQAVQWKPPGVLINGYIEFTVLGGNEVRSRFGSATTDASRNENAVIVTFQQRSAFNELRAAVEDAMVGGAPRASYGGVSPPPPPPPSVPAGWYPDPHGARLQRYWNGIAWTEHTAPLA
jgi:hypothetical protein